jgi:tripartite-type tricarboxylate transporter receptor subunit TctC
MAPRRRHAGELRRAHIQAGTLRLLAVYADRRHPSYPALPTLTESGVPVVQLSFGGVLVPADTPQPVVNTLQSACERATRATADRDWAAKAATLKRLGL